MQIKGKKLPYVSRGGLKLEKALKIFDFEVKDQILLDIGASTGGFTDAALQNGQNELCLRRWLQSVGVETTSRSASSRDGTCEFSLCQTY